MGAFGPRLPAAQLRSDRKIGTWLLVGYIVAFLLAAGLSQFADGRVFALTLVAVIPMTLPVGLIWAMSRRHKDLAKRVAALHGLLCPDCEYPLDHRDSDRCPECGRVASNDAVRAAWAEAGVWEDPAKTARES